MKNNRNEPVWYLSDGSCLKGQEALDYILKYQLQLNELMTEIESDLKEMAKFNTAKEVVGDEKCDSPYTRLLVTLENLSIVEILCEALLEKLKGHLHEPE